MRCSGLVVIIETAGVLDSPFVMTAYAPNVVYRSPNAACTAHAFSERRSEVKLTVAYRS